MKTEYNDISEFLDDVHNQLSIKEIVLQMGLIKKEEFKNYQFTNCIFHNGGNTPCFHVAVPY